MREKITLAAYQASDHPTHDELAARFGVTRRAIGQRIASARAKLYGEAVSTPDSPQRIRPFSLNFRDNI